MMSLILTLQPVNAKQALVATKTAPQVVTQPPSKPHTVKPPATSATANQSSAPQQTALSQMGPSKGRDKPSTLSKDNSGKLQSFQGPHYQKQKSSSLHESFS